MSMRHHGFAALLLVALTAMSARAETETIGRVKTLVGAAWVISVDSDGAARPIGLAMAIHEKDRIETGPDGEVGITFRDNTRITLGPSSRLDLAHFVFQPADKNYGFVLRLAFGTLQYLSGLTAKLAPDAMTIETPGSTIAVRGTRLLIRAEGRR
jgi:hypothetical protein